MIIRFFKSNNPLTFILLPLLALLLWITGFCWGQSVVVKYSMPLYEILIKPISSIHFVGTLIAFILVVLEAFLLNYIVNENEILPKPSYLPALFYIVFMSSDNTLLMIYPLIVANLFILLAIYKLVSSYRKDSAFSNAFDAGILLSIATLFYIPCLVFLPILGIGFILFRPFNWREWLISFIGVLVPYTFVFTYYFWNDRSGYFGDVKLFFSGWHQHTALVLSKSFYFMFTVSVVILLFSFRKLFVGILDASQKNKKGIILLLWFSVLAMLSIFIAPSVSIRSFSSLAIPVSIFCANYFLKIKKSWWAELLFILLIASVFINHF
jgi:hypothetical protein